MNNVWIVVCNAARARIYASHSPPAEWTLIESFDSPEGHETDSELVRDRAGQSSSQGASVHHNALAAKTPPKQVAAERFVRKVVDALDGGLQSNRFGHLVLVAPPRTLGMLRKELSVELTKHVMATVDKDFEHEDAHTLATKLHKEVTIPVDQQDVLRTSERHPH
jgi:protein required for attachment to host cells